jgi:PmbA protein
MFHRKYPGQAYYNWGIMESAELIELANQACRASASAGASDADAIAVESRSVSLEIEKNCVKNCDVEYDAGYSVRAFRRGGIGFARGRGLDISLAKEAGASAASMACEAAPDPDFVTLPQPSQHNAISGLFDPAVAEIEPKTIINWGLRCIGVSRAVAPDVIVKCGAGVTSAKISLANNRGVSVFEEATFVSLYVFSVVNRNSEVGSYYEYTRARRLEDLRQPEEVARIATERAVAFAGARKLPSGRYPVVLGPIAAHDFIHGVISAASAEDIQRGRSYLAGKRGAGIAASCLTVFEDPLYPAGLISSAFDGEGVPTFKQNLIENGILADYLHNSYTANKAREKNNAHASRGSYTSDVGIGATNINITPGTMTESDIVRNIKDGIYIYMGSISPSTVTGQISGTVDYGFRILNGELAYPIQNAMLGGDVFEFLGAIESVSSDFREEKGNIMPSLLVGGVQAAGGG